MQYKHLIVIGAGMAGLASAAALAPHFSEVLERDELPDSGVARRCIPQGKHVHLLRVSGLRALQSLLPGIDQELIAGGALPANIGTGMRLIALGQPTAPFESLHGTLLVSRPTLEFTVR